MLREGWDVKNIAVIVALRKLASQTLTEQILGRGLRLPFGCRTGSLPVDQVDPMLLEKSYYLEPQNSGAKPYALIREARLARAARLAARRPPPAPR